MDSNTHGVIMIQSVKKKMNSERPSEIDVLLMTLEDGTVHHVCLSEDNKDYQEIQEWVAEGNTIEEAD